MKALRAFHDNVVEIFGYLMQVHAALVFWRDFLNDRIRDGSSPNRTIYFGNDDPSNPDPKYQYRRTFAELIKDMGRSGTTLIVLRQSVVVLLVASWEDHHRALIAGECGLERNDLKSDVFHDLNRYRQAILHGGGILREDAKKLQFFGRGQRVDLTAKHMGSIFHMVVEELNEFGVRHYGGNPEFTFDKSMVA